MEEIRPLAGDDEARRCAQMMCSTEPWIAIGCDFDESLKIVQDSTREAYVAADGRHLLGFIILNSAARSSATFKRCASMNKRGASASERGSSNSQSAGFFPKRPTSFSAFHPSTLAPALFKNASVTNSSGS